MRLCKMLCTKHSHQQSGCSWLCPQPMACGSSAKSKVRREKCLHIEHIDAWPGCRSIFEYACILLWDEHDLRACGMVTNGCENVNACSLVPGIRVSSRGMISTGTHRNVLMEKLQKDTRHQAQM